LGVVRVLDLFECNGTTEILYDSAVRQLADIFVCPPATIEEHLRRLAGQGHVSIDFDGAEDPASTGRRVLRIKTPQLLQAVLRADKTSRSGTR